MQAGTVCLPEEHESVVQAELLADTIHDLLMLHIRDPDDSGQLALALELSLTE